jgi:hypothetical protein
MVMELILTTRTMAFVLAASMTTACLGGGSRPRVTASAPPAMSPTESALRGQWELTGLEAQGQPRQATGRLSFDEFNNIAVRAELAPGEAGVTPPRTVLLDFSAKATASGSELTYVALERRAPAEQMVPTASEPSDWRHYAVEGDTLQVWQENPGGQRSGVMTFRRVR